MKGVNGRMDIEIRYALERGASGIYTYAIFSHGANYPAAGEGESRFITQLNPIFDWLSVDADRNLLRPPRKTCARASSSTPRSNGFSARASIKLRRAQIQLLRRAIQDPGLRLLQHQGAHRPLFHQPKHRIPGRRRREAGTGLPHAATILDYWCPGHYAGGAGCNIPAGEKWNKVIGPIFVYCNALADPQVPSQADLDTLAATAGNPTVPPAWKDNATALWQDALDTGQEVKAAMALRLGQRRGLSAQGTDAATSPANWCSTTRRRPRPSCPTSPSAWLTRTTRAPTAGLCGGRATAIGLPGRTTGITTSSGTTAARTASS